MNDKSKMGAVAAGHEVTAEAALAVLRDGGNACDALIAAIWAACVCEPVLAAPAGGGFAMIRDGDAVGLYDFFCDTPRNRADGVEFAKIYADFGPHRQPFHIGAGSAATPGLVAGLTALAGAHGSWPMADLVMPAISAARNGIVLSPFQAFLQGVVAPILTWTPEARSIFPAGFGEAAPGDGLSNPDLACALELIGQGQSSAIEDAILHQSGSYGGHLSSQDLSNYRARHRDPVSLACGAWTVHLNPLPALGGILAAGMLAAAARDAGGSSPLDLARAMAEVDGIWRSAGDDVAGALGLAGGLAGGLSEPHGGQAHRGTTHISVIDRHGKAAAATISNGEGNGRVLADLGFMLNNMLGEEDLNPKGFDAWIPGRRLASMMTPVIAVRDDGTVAALGSGGSNRIRTAIFQTLAGRILQDRTASQAIEAPRLHFERGHLDIERAQDRGDVAELAAAFGEPTLWPRDSLYFGGVHWVERDPEGRFTGAGDPRRSGEFRCA